MSAKVRYESGLGPNNKIHMHISKKLLLRNKSVADDLTINNTNCKINRRYFGKHLHQNNKFSNINLEQHEIM